MAQKINSSQINDTYSTSEQNTGKTWVDGRPVYRKVLRGQVTIAVGINTIAHGISSITNSFEVVSFNGMTKLGQGSGTASSGLQIYHRETAGNWCSWTAVNSTTVALTSSFAWGNTYYNVVMEYVK